MARAEQIPVYILAGGKSQRFGSDKARANIEGEPLILRLKRQISPFAERITVVAREEEQYRDLELHTLADRTPDRGPLGGLARALEDLADRGDRWLLLLACDQLDISDDVISELLAARTLTADAVALRDTRWFPFPSAFSRTMLPTARAALEGEQRSLWRVFERARTVPVVPPKSWSRSVNINTSAELKRYLLR